MPAVDGIASGFDTTGLIDAIVSVARLPLQNMERQMDALEDKRERIAGLSNRLTALQENIESFQEDRLKVSSAVASDEAIAVTADSDAPAGTYTFSVSSLATSEVNRSAAFASTATGELQNGTLEIEYQGETHAIVIDGDNDGLDALAASISEISGLNAYVIDDGSGSGSPFSLVVTGETGLANGITITEPSGSSLGFTETRAATDTVADLDGQTVYSADTTLRNIPGLEIDVSAAPSGTHTVTVANDADATLERLQTFVDAYNEVQDYYGVQSSFNSEANIAGALVGESGARRVIDTLGSLVSSAAGTGELVALSQIGISTQQDGRLELDADVFKEQLQARPDAVEALFLSEDGPIEAIRARIEDVFVEPESGTLASRSESIEGSIRELETAIERKESFLESYTGRLRSQFNALETNLAQLQSTSQFLTALLPQTDLV